MSNYYVSTYPTFKMMFRGTLEQCREYATKLAKEWAQMGRKMQYAIYYDTGTKPEEIVG